MYINILKSLSRKVKRQNDYGSGRKGEDWGESPSRVLNSSTSSSNSTLLLQKELYREINIIVVGSNGIGVIRPHHPASEDTKIAVEVSIEYRTGGTELRLNPAILDSWPFSTNQIRASRHNKDANFSFASIRGIISS